MTDVSRPLLIDAARLARMAYVAPEKVQSLYKSVQENDIPPDADVETAEVLKRVSEEPTFLNDPYSDAQGYGVRYSGIDGPVTMLVYRGTSNLSDIIADGDVQLVPLKTYLATSPKGVLVHAGFSGQFSGLELQSNDFLSKIYSGLGTILPITDTDPESGPSFDISGGDDVPVSSPAEDESTTLESPLGSFSQGPPLIVLGHSLGSAVSAIGAMVFSLRYGPGVSYIGFGTPRVGNTEWADLFAEQIVSATRVKQGRDPIDSILAPVIYRHVGSKIHVGAADPFPDLCLLTDICDHDMTQYIDQLKKENTSEQPLKWVPYVTGFLINKPVAIYNFVRSFAFYTPF